MSRSTWTVTTGVMFMHFPVGDSAAEELTRVAAEVGADILVVEARKHDPRGPRRFLDRSVVALREHDFVLILMDV